MKIQTTAVVTSVRIGNKSTNPEGGLPIELEFSAIDTGGGFKDPILDFSIMIEDSDLLELVREHQKFSLTLVDPRNKENEATLFYEYNIQADDEQVNGRLKEDQLSRDLIGFVLQLLR